MGPTGSGKTAQSLAMAKAGLPVCIINADSRQLYKDFPIISAQPDTEEKALCPHTLFGYLETKEASSAGDWLEKAKNEIALAHARAYPALWKFLRQQAKNSANGIRKPRKTRNTTFCVSVSACRSASSLLSYIRGRRSCLKTGQWKKQKQPWSIAPILPLPAGPA